MNDKIISSIHNGLLDDPSVYAFWIEGSHAHDTADEYSDIDMWFDVEDGAEDCVLGSITAIVLTISPIDRERTIDNPHPHIRQVVIHIAGTPDYMNLDICIQSHSRNISFLNGFVDQKIRVLFDKCNVIKHIEPDWQAFRDEQVKRIEAIRSAYPVLQTNISKEIARGNFLEALNYYHEALKLLVEILRMKHQPTKRDFHLKHISRDLPEDVVSRLTNLYAVTSTGDINEKRETVNDMFRETINGLQNEA